MSATANASGALDATARCWRHPSRRRPPPRSTTSGGRPSRVGCRRLAMVNASPRGCLPGYRWIAVRPGSGPPPRRVRRPLGPTPALRRPFRAGACKTTSRSSTSRRRWRRRAGPSVRMVRATTVLTMIAFGLAALAPPRPVRTAADQPHRPVGPHRGGCCHLVGCRRERAGRVHDDRDGGGVDELAGGAPRRGVCTARTAPRHVRRRNSTSAAWCLWSTCSRRRSSSSSWP